MINIADIKEIDPTATTPLGKYKVYVQSDLKFFIATPRKIEWNKDGEMMTAVLSPKEAKSVQPNYKLTSGDKTRMVPVFQIIKSLEVTPASKITSFEVADFVKPKI